MCRINLFKNYPYSIEPLVKNLLRKNYTRNVKVPSVGQIELFKNYPYSIEPLVKIL